MPKPTVSNPRHSSRVVAGAGRRAPGWTDPSEAVVNFSCDLCSSMRGLREKTIDGERIVLCGSCARSNDVDVSDWKKVTGTRPAEVDGTPDRKALRRQGFHGGNDPQSVIYFAKRSHNRLHPFCSYTGCQRRVFAKGGIACREHWDIVPRSLKDPLNAAIKRGEGDLRSTRQAVVRYLEMRSRFAKASGS